MSVDLQQIGPWLNGLGVPGLLAVGLYALHRGWVVTGREHERTCGDHERRRLEDLRRYEEMRAERDEWKDAALRHLAWPSGPWTPSPGRPSTRGGRRRRRR